MSKCNKTIIICNKAPTSVIEHLPNVIIHLPNVMYPMLSPTLAPVLASSWGGSRWENRTWGACWNFLRPSLNSCEHVKHYIIIIYQCTVNQLLFTTKNNNKAKKNSFLVFKTLAHHVLWFCNYSVLFSYYKGLDFSNWI